MKHLRPSIVFTLFFIVAFGLVFPAVIYGVSQVVFPHQANGSLVKDASGKVIGSELIGQAFSSPKYFHPRPSAAGSGYDAGNSGGTNLGPTSDKLINGVHDPKNPSGDFNGVKDLASAYRKENGLAPDAELPADAATYSASGLDPQISPANAALQVARVATARGMSADSVRTIVAEHTAGPWLGLFGEPRVNVLELNLALDASSGK